MPYRKSTYRRRKPKSKAKRSQTRKRRTVSSMPRQIQNATYMPKSRLLRFSGYRSFVVKDTGFNTTGALPPILEIGANNPRKFIHTTQGTWNSSSLGGKGVAVAGIDQWVAEKIPGASSTASYLNAQTLSCKVVITACPMPMKSDSDEDAHADIIQMFLQNNTRGGNMTQKNISTDFNSEVIGQSIGMKSATLYTNPNGTPRGATMSMAYSFKKQNKGLGSQVHNYFYADTDPAEKDFINLAFLSTDDTQYGLESAGYTRLPDIRVQVKVSYIVLLSEPNTAIGNSELNAGNDLPYIPTITEGGGESAV